MRGRAVSAEVALKLVLSRRAERERGVGARDVEKRQPKQRMRWWAVALIGLGVVASAYRVICGTYTSQGPSMEPALLDGDRFVILRSVWAGEPQPGEVIVARAPAGDIEFVKHVIAVGGQTIAIRNDEVRVDARRSARRSSAPGPSTFSSRTSFGAPASESVSASGPSSGPPFRCPKTWRRSPCPRGTCS